MPLNTNAVLSAVKKAKAKSKKRNFTQSVELIVNLRNIDIEKPENRIQEIVELPHALEKGNKICVIASGELALKAEKAGADAVIKRAELEALAGDKKKQKKLSKSYDFFIAEAPMMPLIGKILGPVLGPKGKMPTPVPPTVDIAQRLQKYKKAVRVRMRHQSILQCCVGTENMQNERIVENIQAVIGRIERKLEKGLLNVQSVYIKTTMGPPVPAKK
ncbi:MAG: 50S ribosomal protein L1 [Thermoproteota archaeon]|nr:50S ribosomal protein L1 [Thermoproteota archaeon]